MGLSVIAAQGHPAPGEPTTSAWPNYKFKSPHQLILGEVALQSNRGCSRMLRALAWQFLGFLVALPLLLGTLFQILRHGWSKVTAVKDRSRPPATLTDPQWGVHGYLQLPRVKIHYVENGNKANANPLLLMIHGYPEFWFSWRNQLCFFAQKDYWCVAVDNRGYGDSDKPPGVDDYHLDTLVDDVKHVIEALGRKSCILMGHDWGGAIGYYFCEKYPEMVDRYIVVNLPHPLSLERELVQSWDQLIKSWYMIFFQCPWIPECFMRLGDMRVFNTMMKDMKMSDASDILEAYKYTFRRPNDFRGPINYYRSAWRSPVHHKPKLLDLPVLSVYGTNDSYLGKKAFEGSRDFVEIFQDYPIDGLSHWSMMESPDLVNRAIEEFLNAKASLNQA